MRNVEIAEGTIQRNEPQALSLLWPGYFAAMQNELWKTTDFVQHFPIC